MRFGQAEWVTMGLTTALDALDNQRVTSQLCSRTHLLVFEATCRGAVRTITTAVLGD